MHGKIVECYAEEKIDVTGRYNGKYILLSAFFMNNPGEFEGMEEATLKDLAFLSRSSRESDKVGPDGCVSTV